MSLGARIRDLRQSRELTQRELATAVGKNSTYLSKIENDREKPSESLIHAVADALGVDVNELLLLAGRVPPEFREALRRGPDAAAEALAIAQQPSTTGDRLYDDIMSGLAGVSDGNLFEKCACSILKSAYPSLACWPGGSDAGVDGMIVDEDGQLILVSTISERVVRNLEHNLQSYLESSGSARRAVLATTQSLSAPQRRKLEEKARELGFALLNIHAREDLAERLYRDSRWLKELLGLTGQPSALSVVPRDGRPQLGDVLIGRESDVAFLRTISDDAVIVGRPGIGKTSLMRDVVRSGRGLFLVDDDITNIADALRREQPSLVIVDDAPANLSGLQHLMTVRAQNASSTFFIIATCWADDEALTLNALGLPRSAAHYVEPLTRSQIVDVIHGIGLLGPNALVRHIVDQARGRPGLAAALAHMTLTRDSRDYNEAVSGDAVRRLLLTNVSIRASEATVQVLATLALGGDRGLSRELVAEILGMTQLSVYALLAPLAVGGVIDEDRNSDGVVVWPETLRYALINEAFFGAPRLLPEGIISSIPNRHALSRTLVLARRYGVPIPNDLLWNLVVETGAGVSDFAALGPDQSKRLLEIYPEAATRIADEGLRQAPEVLLPALFRLAIGDERGIPQTPEHPLRKIDDWIDYSPLSSGEPIRRRRLLLDATRIWLQQGGDISIAGKALSIALSPRSKVNSIDPGAGMTISFAHRFLGTADVYELASLWSGASDMFYQLGIPELRLLVDTLTSYVHPMSVPEPTPLEVAEAMDVVACDTIRLLVRVASGKAGILYELRRLAEAASCKVEIQLSADYEVVYPRRNLDDADHWERSRELHTQALAGLAESYAGMPPEVVLDRLLDLTIDAPRNPPVFLYDSIAILVSEIAKRVTEIPFWLTPIFAQPKLNRFVWPFLQRLIDEGHGSGAQWLAVALNSQASEWPAIALILMHEALFCQLREEVMPRLASYAESIHVMCLRGEIPLPVVRRLLTHDDPGVAAGAATGIGYEKNGNEISDEIRSEWRAAITRAPLGRTAVGLLLKAKPDLARDWLLARTSDGSIGTVGSHHDFSVIEACKALDVEGRLSVLRALLDRYDEDRWFFVAEEARMIIGEELDTFKAILEDDGMRRTHLLGLTGLPEEGWAEKAIAALNAGYSVDNIVHAAYSYSILSWNGNESEMWLGWRDAFLRLAEEIDEPVATENRLRIEKVSKMGAEIAQQSADRAAATERHEAVYGRG